jgi:hypothetical protein
MAMANVVLYPPQITVKTTLSCRSPIWPGSQKRDDAKELKDAFYGGEDD